MKVIIVVLFFITSYRLDQHLHQLLLILEHRLELLRFDIESLRFKVDSSQLNFLTTLGLVLFKLEFLFVQRKLTLLQVVVAIRFGSKRSGSSNCTGNVRYVLVTAWVGSANDSWWTGLLFFLGGACSAFSAARYSFARERPALEFIAAIWMILAWLALVVFLSSTDSFFSAKANS